LDKLRPGGCTNLWDGLVKGLQHIHTGIQTTSNNCVLLLTDGEPTEHPQLGYGPSLLKKNQEMNGFKCTISTFGFGYSLDSALLDELAVIGHGKYSFIPDSGLVGTVFVNSLSNLLSTYANDVSVNLGDALAKKLKVDDGRVSGYKLDGTVLHLGSINLGQPKNLVLSLSSEATSADLEGLNVSFHAVGGNAANAPAHVSAFGAEEANTLKAHSLRVQLVNTLRQIIANKDNLAASKKLVEVLLAKFIQAESQDAYVLDLHKDLEGQITEAISKPEWFKKWGRHYLPSLLGAHLYQQCNNFKDPGVQHYGGKVFFSLRDDIDEIFLKLPPPKPTKTNYATGQTYAAPATMHAYYNAGGG
jgi:hypothetical protein